MSETQNSFKPDLPLPPLAWTRPRLVPYRMLRYGTVRYLMILEGREGVENRQKKNRRSF